MAKFFVSAPAQLPAFLVKEASALNMEVSYKPNPNKEGSKVERDVYNILLLLQAEEVFLPPSKVIKGEEYLSYLDTRLKTDILLKVGNFYLCWQVKSSMERAKDHLALDKVSFKGKAYPVPGLIVMDSWEQGKTGWRVKVLSEISKVSGVPVKEEVIVSIEKWKKLRALKKDKVVLKLPSSVFSSEESVNLTTLGLIQVQGKEVVFM